MQNTAPKFTPILFGSDFNVYGMARSFYEINQQPVRALAEVQLAPTRYSKIVNVELIPNFSEDPVWIAELRKLKEEYRNHPEPVILIACSDGYSELISKHKAELKDVFVCPNVDFDLANQLNTKENFYQLCDQYALPYPKTRLISKIDYQNGTYTQPDTYPVALKPANSIEWVDIHFEGRKKVFIIRSAAEFNEVIKKIYTNGYTSDMILQDFIPGDDSNMRVVNAYVDKQHHVKMMCLGHPLLEDPAPGAIGNYVAILPEYDEKIYQQLQNFLEQINYTGFADFDLKWDVRDHSFKLFEINLRQGRSSFYVTLAGYNLAQWLVDDYVNDNLAKREPVFGNQDDQHRQLWLGVPPATFKKFAKANADKAVAEKLLATGRFGTTFWYKKDRNPMRWLLFKWMNHNYKKDFATYFAREKGDN